MNHHPLPDPLELSRLAHLRRLELRIRYLTMQRLERQIEEAFHAAVNPQAGYHAPRLGAEPEILQPPQPERVHAAGTSAHHPLIRGIEEAHGLAPQPHGLISLLPSELQASAHMLAAHRKAGVALIIGAIAAAIYAGKLPAWIPHDALHQVGLCGPTYPPQPQIVPQR